MKPSTISKILDVAYEVRKLNKTYVPCFSGDAGIGKSEICQAWVKEKRKTNPNFGFLDLRLAYLEAPDLIGLTKVVKMGGQDRTENMLPAFWPIEGEGLLLLEEPNRANSSILNALMQLLTDRTIHNYKLPDGWVIASCINPDNGNYDVTNMDTALKNRFEIFDVKYHQKDFVDFMRANDFDPNIISFIEGGHWVFKSVDEIGEEGYYISPRTFAKLNASRKADTVKSDESLHHEIAVATLGKAYGVAFHKFVHELKPLVAKDFVGKKAEKSLEKLKAYSHPDTYRADLLSVTITTVSDEFGNSITDEMLSKIAAILPADLAVNLLTDSFVKLLKKSKEGKFTGPTSFKDWIKNYPELESSLKSRLQGSYTSLEDKKEKTK